MFSPSVVFNDSLSVKRIYTAFVARRKKDFDFNGESHNFWELVYINSGTVGITSGSRVFECGAGTVVLHKPGEFHRIWAVGGTEPVYTVLSFDVESGYIGRLGSMAILLDSDESEIIERISRLILSLELGGSIFPTMLNSQPVLAARLQKLLELALILCIEKGGNAVFEADSPDVLLFASAVGIMKENVSAPLSSEEIAESMHISLSKLKRVFKKYAMTGVHEYYFILRLNKAAKMIMSGKSAKECADECGFLNQNYFSAAFKRHFGVSPSRFK